MTPESDLGLTDRRFSGVHCKENGGFQIERWFERTTPHTSSRYMGIWKSLLSAGLSAEEARLLSLTCSIRDALITQEILVI